MIKNYYICNMSTARSKNLKGIAFEVQYEMCDTIYRKLLEIISSLFIKEVSVEFEKYGKVRMTESSKGVMDFYFFSKNDNRNLGQIYFNKQLSSTEIECPVMAFMLAKKDMFPQSKAEEYHKWLNSVKKTMQELVNEQGKYENILDDIKSIPMFSPTREVIIEKKK